MSKVKLCYFLQMLKVLVHNSRFRDYQKVPPLLIAAVLDYLAKFWSTTLDLEICYCSCIGLFGQVLVHNSIFRDYQKLPPLLIAAVLDYMAKFWSTTLDLEI